MKKNLILTLLCLVFVVFNLFAQKTQRDSVIKIAKTDARNLWLNKADRARFKEDKENHSSDLFKPTVLVVSENKLLQDSIYVKTFRAEAYNRARKKYRSVGHKMLIWYIWYEAGVVLSIALINLSGKSFK